MWADEGQTKVSYYAPEALADRYHLGPDPARNLAGIDALTDAGEAVAARPVGEDMLSAEA